jgi:hypothetical protein
MLRRGLATSSRIAVMLPACLDHVAAIVPDDTTPCLKYCRLPRSPKDTFGRTRKYKRTRMRMHKHTHTHAHAHSHTKTKSKTNTHMCTRSRTHTLRSLWFLSAGGGAAPHTPRHGAPPLTAPMLIRRLLWGSMGVCEWCSPPPTPSPRARKLCSREGG